MAAKTFLLTLAFVVLSAGGAPQVRALQSGVADTTAIHAFWSDLDDTWGARDADRFSRLFTDDASFGFVDRGRSLEGRATIHGHFTDQFGSQRPELRHATRITRIHPLAQDVVAVDGEVEVLEERQGEASPAVFRRLAISGVMVRDGARWRIHLLRAYTLAPPPGP